MKSIKIMLLAVFALCFQTGFAQESPVPMLEKTADQIIATLKQNKATLKNNPQVIYAAVQQHLLPNVDVTGMSRSVLGHQAWKKASAAERSEFTQSFTRLVIRTYASPLREYSGETVHFLPYRASQDDRFTRVNSLIVRPSGQKIPLNYSLVNKNGQWKIYDLSVEGVSLLQSFHNQFSQVLQNSSMHELIAQMNKTKAQRDA